MADFELPIRIYWEDTDAGGIVFYANYLKFFERARTEWLRTRGVQQQALREQTGGMFVVSECHVQYLRAARLDDELVITARLEETGRASLALTQQAYLQTAPGQRGALLSQARIRIGWVDAQRLSPARIPSSLIERLTS